MRRGPVTRLIGRLEVRHAEGEITFSLRNPQEIDRRGTRVLLIIKNAGFIPQLRDGKILVVDCTQVGLEIEHASGDIEIKL